MASPRLRVLIVEDNHTLSSLITQALKVRNFQSSSAENGLEGRAIAYSESTEDLEQIGHIPTSPQAFSFDTNVEGFILFEQVQGDVLKHGKVLRSVVFVSTVIVLTEGDVQHPMYVIFNLPMMTSDSQKALGIRW